MKLSKRSKAIKNNITNYRKGILAEYYASIILFCKGYKILDRRYKNKFGEIDLILKHKNCIVFCEEKYRRTLELSAWSLSNRQKRRIINGSQIFLLRNKKWQNKDIRFDYLAIAGIHFKHYINAWSLD